MPTYTYKVRDKSGQVRELTADVADIKALRSQVDAEGQFLIEYSEKKKSSSPAKSSRSRSKQADSSFSNLFQKITKTTISVFSWQLYTLLNAGVPLADALTVVVGQTENQKLKETIVKIQKKVTEGVSFSDALGDYPKVFSNLYVRMINAGEIGGVLDDMVKRLAIFYEHQAETQSRVKQALAYPILLLTVSMAVTIFLITYVLPKFAVIFQDIGADIPAPTQVLLNLSVVLREYWFVVFMVLFGLAIVLRIYIQTPAGRYQFDGFKLMIPGVGDLIKKNISAEFSQTLSTLVGAGIPMLTTLSVVTETIENKVIVEALEHVTDKVSEGKTLADPMEETKVFPDMVVSMIKVGEETGSLENTLSKVADFYAREVDGAIKGITKTIEPILIVVMTVLIGFIAISIFLPLTDLMSGFNV